MVSDVSIVRDGDMLCASVSIPNVAAERVLRAWIEPEELKRWWGNGELTVEPEVGGAYEIYFDQSDARMIGKIRNLSPMGTLRFTWSWLHETDQPQRVVTVRIRDTDDGSDLVLTHGPYDFDEPAFGEHRDGWAHFLPQLVTMLAA